MAPLRALALVGWLLALLALPRTVEAATLPFTGTLSLQFGGLAPLVMNGGGTAVVNGSGPIGVTGVTVTQISVPAGAFTASAILAPLSALSPIVQFGVMGSNSAIVLSASAPPCSVPHPQVSCAGSAGLHGRGGLAAILRIGVLGSFGSPLATLPITLTPIGGGGAATGVNTSLAASARVFGGGWTTGRVSAFRTVLGETVSTLATTGGLSHTAGGGWALQMVTPLAFQSSLTPNVTVPGFASIDLVLAPEPSTGLLLGLGCIGLCSLGRRRLRRESRTKLDRRLASLGVVALVAFGSAAPARADLVTQSRALSGNFDAVAFAPFDTSLGTLDRVLVRIEGTLTQPFAPTQAIPAFYTIQPAQRFSSPFGRGFEFESDALFHFSGQSDQPSPRFTAVSYDFAFDAQTDLIGFAIPQVSGALQPPTAVNGTRAEFERLAVPGDPGIQIEMLMLPPVTTGPVAASPTAFDGVVTLQYVYTPALPPPAPLGPDRVLVPVFDATDTLRIDAIDPQTGDVVVLFEPGAVRLPVVIGGLWGEPDGSVLVTHENDALFPDVAVVKRIRLDGQLEVVTTLGGLSNRPGVDRPQDTALVGGSALMIADAGPLDGAALDGRIVRVDPATGDARVLVDVGQLTNPNRLAAAANGSLYVAESPDPAANADGAIYQVDPETGALALVSSPGVLVRAADLDVAPDGRLLWLEEAPPGQETVLLRVDPANGATSVLVDQIVDASGVYIGTQTLGMVEFPSLGIIALTAQGAEANMDQIKRFHVDLYSDNVVLAIGDDIDAGAGPPSAPPMTPCNDGADNDADGDIDLADPGCVGALDLSEAPDCADGLDNDRDGNIDGTDTACDSALDPSEHPDCSNGLDDDSDGAVDFPADAGCLDAFSASEAPACSNGADDDGDGAIDDADPECLGPGDDSEEAPVCWNGSDDDGDGLMDFPDDPGCRSAFSEIEDPACDNGVDDDQDGAIDTADESCSEAYLDSEERSCFDGIDNDRDAQVDFGFPGVPRECFNHFSCFDGNTLCVDSICQGGPRFGMACTVDEDCRIDCVDSVCEEAVLPRACTSPADCDGAPCNSAGFCVGTEGAIAADDDCLRIGTEAVPAQTLKVSAYCGLGGELVLAYALLRAVVRRRRAR